MPLDPLVPREEPLARFDDPLARFDDPLLRPDAALDERDEPLRRWAAVFPRDDAPAFGELPFFAGLVFFAGLLFCAEDPLFLRALLCFCEADARVFARPAPLLFR